MTIKCDIADLLIPLSLLIVLHGVRQLCTVLDEIRIFLNTTTSGELLRNFTIPHLINIGNKLQLLGSADSHRTVPYLNGFSHFHSDRGHKQTIRHSICRIVTDTDIIHILKRHLAVYTHIAFCLTPRHVLLGRNHLCHQVISLIATGNDHRYGTEPRAGLIHSILPTHIIVAEHLDGERLFQICRCVILVWFIILSPLTVASHSGIITSGKTEPIILRFIIREHIHVTAITRCHLFCRQSVNACVTVLSTAEMSFEHRLIIITTAYVLCRILTIAYDGRNVVGVRNRSREQAVLYPNIFFPC